MRKSVRNLFVGKSSLQNEKFSFAVNNDKTRLHTNTLANNERFKGLHLGFGERERERESNAALMDEQKDK